MKQSSTFCPVPWVQLATNASGHYRVCCNALPGKNLVLDENNKAMSIYKHSVEKAWESETYKKIRSELTHSVKPEMCARCFREEDSGMESARQRWVKRWPDINAEVYQASTIKYIDLRLGNHCNLKCRMCNPYSSNKWVDEWNEVVGTADLIPNQALHPDEMQRLKKMDWPESPKTWENLFTIVEHLEEIYLTGGEPFLSLEQVLLLKEIIKRNKAKDIVLKYNTNLTLLPDRLVEVWKYFKIVKINVSIDGIGELLNYIRYPAQWNEVQKNLEKILSLKSQGYRIDLGVHVTVQMYNALDIHTIFQHFKETYNIVPYLNVLNHPHCLNIRTLPDSLKEKVTDNCRDIHELNEVLLYMNRESWFGNCFTSFTKYTQQLDKLRNQKFSLVVPAFFEGNNFEFSP